MLKTIDRLMQFITYTGLSARQFDLSIGAGNGYILRMKKNNASIGSDVIETIIKTYPQLNVAWLITGEGEMLRNGENPDIGVLESLSKEERKQIERIIEAKIRQRQAEERKHLLKEITEEIERSQRGSGKGRS